MAPSDATPGIGDGRFARAGRIMWNVAPTTRLLGETIAASVKTLSVRALATSPQRGRSQGAAAPAATGLVPERRPVRREDQRGQHETEHDVDRNARTERNERLSARRGQLAEPRRQTDA